MNPVTMTVSVSTRGAEELRRDVRAAFAETEAESADARVRHRVYDDPEALMGAADRIATSPAGVVLRWTYLADGWDDVRTIERALAQMSDDGYAWQSVRQDDYDTESDAYGQGPDDFVVNDDAVAFDLFVDDVVEAIPSAMTAPTDKDECPFCRKAGTVEHGETERSMRLHAGRETPMLSQVSTCRACGATYREDYAWFGAEIVDRA